MSELDTRSDPEEGSSDVRINPRTMALARRLADPAFPGIVLFVGVVVVGFAAIILAWHGASRSVHVPLQLPFVVSGGLGGLALVITGACLALVHSDRRDRAMERQQDRMVLDELRELGQLIGELQEEELW